MDLETMPRRGRRAVALAGLALAAVMTVAGCNGDGKSASDSATAGASASPSASTAPQVPAPSGSPSGATEPGSPPDSGRPAQPPTGSTPTPASPAPGQPAPATPPANGIAPGEPDPNGSGSPTRPPVAYRVDGTTKLTVYFFGGVCTKYALKADESQPGRVDVTIVSGPPTVQPGQVCNALAKRQSVSADLRSPLAGRTVVDRTSGQELPLEADPHAGPDPVTPDVAGQ
ncbi:lipase chaperone [Streptomyces sp. NRRL S-350]|uniref:lipase chaperone n=1 Tax=Streptomyces sp. NRRL S-350 TaxID=1463902 RepID=UPI00068AD088|nr:lipase chaperone [Streptomyces sp. NRRL S-350]